MKAEDHVFFQLDLRVRADGRMLDHGHADGVAGEVSERKAGFAEDLGGGFVDFAGNHAVAHPDARGFHGVRIDFAHRLRARADFAADEGAGEFNPIAGGSGDFQRVKQQVVGTDFTERRNLEKCFSFAVCAA